MPWWLWLLTILAILLTLLAMLLAVPVDFSFRAETRERLRTRGRIEWLWGVVGWNIRPSGEPGEERPEKEKRKEKKEKKPRSGRRGSFWDLSADLWDYGFFDGAFRLLGRLLRSINVRELRLSGRVGLDDPAETGRALGLIGPVSAFAGLVPMLDLDVQPDFDEAGVRGEFVADVRLVPLLVVVPALLFVLSPVTIRSAWRVWRWQRA